MAESEKMAALKKGYAGILFNTAKEAAERVMATEKKAAGYHQELRRTKDEALRLLVRIKQMAEAKMIEAEVKSSKQESKIDELEAQLQEAEGIIIDLREELKLARDKLENVRNNQVQVLNGQAMEDNVLSSQNATPELITPSNCNMDCQTATTSDKTNLLQDQKNPNSGCCNTSEQSKQLNISHLENHSTDAALIIRRNKEQEMYRNGCKQKIHAMVGDSLDKRLPPPGEVVDRSVIKNELILKVGSINEWKHLITSPKANKIETKKNLSEDEVRKHVKAFRSRRRKARFGKAKTRRRSCFSQLMKSYQPPSIFSRSKRCSFNENVKLDECSLLPLIKTHNVDIAKSSVKVEEKLLNKSSSFEDELMTAHKEKRQRTVQSRTPISNSFSFPPEQQPTIFQPFSLFSRCKTYSSSLDGIIKSIDNLPKMTGNLIKLSPLQRLDPGLTLIRNGTDPVSGSVNVTVSAKAFNRSDSVQIPASKSMESTDELLKQELLKQKRDAIPDSTLFCRESNATAMVSAPLMHSKLEDSKVSEGTMAGIPVVHCDVRDVKPSKDKNMTLKYTFQRKRKKESSSSSDKSSYLEKSIAERRAEETQNGSLEGEESNLTNETCRDSGRLAQVARQFISLSGNRWWH